MESRHAAEVRSSDLYLAWIQAHLLPVKDQVYGRRPMPGMDLAIRTPPPPPPAFLSAWKRRGRAHLRITVTWLIAVTIANSQVLSYSYYRSGWSSLKLHDVIKAGIARPRGRNVVYTVPCDSCLDNIMKF